MKLGTMIKLSALGAAAASTAAGSMFVTVKALKKFGGQTSLDDQSEQNNNLDDISAKETIITNDIKTNYENSDISPANPTFEAEHVSVAENTTNPVVEPVMSDFSFVTPAPAYAEPAPTAPTPMPVQPEPTPIPVPVPEPVPAPVQVTTEESVPPVAPPAASNEPASQETYEYVPMDLPYLAGKLGKEDEEFAEVIVTPVQQKAAEEVNLTDKIGQEAEMLAQNQVESPVSAEPITENVQPVIFAEPIATQSVPEVQTSSVGTIDNASVAPIISNETSTFSQTFADINPLAQDSSIEMTDNSGDFLPTASETEIPETFADLSTAYEGSPVTFNDLNSEYVEEIPSVVVEVKKNEPADIHETPVTSESTVDTPVMSTEPQAEAANPTDGNRTVTIGGAIVSDDNSNNAIKAVVSAFGVPAENLVAITAEGNAPMVFEFIYSDMRTDATLINIYFILPDGQATLPPEMERENVLAFGRNFIAENNELKNFLK